MHAEPPHHREASHEEGRGGASDAAAVPELDLTMGAEAWVVKYADSSNAFGIQFVPTTPGPAQ